MDDQSGKVLTDNFLKSSLFLQVFKASVALSVLHACPTFLEEDEFTMHLQKLNCLYERHKNLSFFHANQLKLPYCGNLIGADSQVICYDNGSLLKPHECVLSQLLTNITAIRIGFCGLLETNALVYERHIVPGLSTMLEVLSRMEQYSSNSEDSDLLNQIAHLRAEVCNAFGVTGEIVAKLDVEGLSTTEIGRCLSFILSPTFTVKEEHSDRWIYPIKSFVKYYWRYVRENTDGTRTPHIANLLTKHLLGNLPLLLKLLNLDPNSQSQSLNNPFARLYALTMPLLDGFRQKSHISRDMIDAIEEAYVAVQQIKTDNMEHTRLSNGSLLLLQSMENKLQFLNNLLN